MSIKFQQLFLTIAFVAAAFGVAGAQTTEINRVEFFGGFSHNRVDVGLESDDFDEEFGNRLGTNGVNLSVTGNFSKYVGAKFDFAHHRKTENFDFDGDNFDEKYSNNTFMGGIQIKNNSKDGPRVKPFAHALAGVSRQKFSVVDNDSTFDFELSQTNFTFAIGGGIDVRATKNIDIRVIQLDYNPTYLKDQDILGTTINGKLQNNFRIGFGIAIH